MAFVDIELDMDALAKISAAARAAALETAEAVKTDIIASQTMPFDQGTTEGSLYVSQTDDGDVVHTALGTDTLYARFLYYGRLMLASNGSSWARRGEKKVVSQKTLNYQKVNNPNAGSAWYKPYTEGGTKEDFVSETMAAKMKEKMP